MAIGSKFRPESSLDDGMWDAESCMPSIPAYDAGGCEADDEIGGSMDWLREWRWAVILGGRDVGLMARDAIRYIGGAAAEMTGIP